MVLVGVHLSRVPVSSALTLKKVSSRKLLLKQSDVQE